MPGVSLSVRSHSRSLTAETTEVVPKRGHLLWHFTKRGQAGSKQLQGYYAGQFLMQAQNSITLLSEQGEWPSKTLKKSEDLLLEQTVRSVRPAVA